MLLGIDEAGRGPVLGPMIIGAVAAPKEKFNSLDKSGFENSKFLSEKQRKEAFGHIEKFKSSFYKIEAKEINKRNLNKIFKEYTTKLINEMKPKKAIIDTPTSKGGLKKFKDQIDSKIKYDTIIRCKNKADNKYSIVSAASILAKEKREEEVKRINEKYKTKFSGYPSDQKTTKFLKRFYKENGEFPEETRLNWNTVSKIKNQIKT